MPVQFEKIDKALLQLKTSVQLKHPSNLERDGIIQRFEYTIELLWKISKRVLAENGIIALTPREVIRELANIGWIDNPDTFIGLLKLRNETSHSYEEEIAQKAYLEAVKFVPICESLLKILKEKSP
jgi:nucleotidyltransferase substrate binding protein (TIGR01987 family)